MVPSLALAALFFVTAPTGRATPAPIDAVAVRQAATAVRTGDFTLLPGLIESNPEHDTLAILFVVLKESIDDANENKKYFLAKLSMFNQMGEELSDYLDELTDQRGRGGTQQVATRKVVTVAPGIQALVPAGPRRWSEAELDAEIQRMRRLAKTVRAEIIGARKRSKELGIRRVQIGATVKVWRHLLDAVADDDTNDDDTDDAARGRAAR